MKDKNNGFGYKINAKRRTRMFADLEVIDFYGHQLKMYSNIFIFSF